MSDQTNTSTDIIKDLTKLLKEIQQPEEIPEDRGAKALLKRRDGDED